MGRDACTGTIGLDKAGVTVNPKYVLPSYLIFPINECSIFMVPPFVQERWLFFFWFFCWSGGALDFDSQCDSAVLGEKPARHLNKSSD